MSIRKLVLSMAAAAACCGVATAQYPTVPDDVAAASANAKAAADRRSDEAFARALPVIEKEAREGRPYTPWANHPFDLRQARIPAFPGAWGGGMYTQGGRGGKVYVVTSLEDSGPGTFREACEAGGARVVVFNVAGIIRLKDRIRIRAPYITIVGSTAPGDGVCIAGNTVELETHDIIIRHMRFRRGETGVGDRNDSIGGNPTGNVMIDHVSASWGLDENMSMYRHMTDVSPYVDDHPVVRGKYRESWSPANPNQDLKLPTVNITIQNSIFSEGLDTYNHAFGSTIGGRNSTFHHNLWACNTGRNPSIGMDGDIAIVNNVMFNWRHRTIDGGDHLSMYNIINNYFKPGPVTDLNNPISYRILKPESRRGRNVPRDFGVAYVAGNVVEGNERVTKDNWDGGVQIGEGDAEAILPSIRQDRPFSMAPLPIVPAVQAFEQVLASAGATWPVRDPVDTRVIEMVRSGQVTYTEGKGIITDIAQVGGYPEYKGTPYVDTDKDGMPDDWELAQGLDPKNAADAAMDRDNDGYTNIEQFMYAIPADHDIDWTDLRSNIDTLKTARAAGQAASAR